MSFLDAMERFGTRIPTDDEVYENTVNAQPTPTPVDPGSYNWEWQREYDALRSANYTAMTGYLSPYDGTGWGGSPAIFNNLERLFEEAVSPKLEPSKLFTSETAQLRAIAADQAKIVRLFEAKLKEGLTEKGKFGLTEMDIEGLQALTAARGAIVANAKEQVAVKAKIAELKIKQQQAAAQSAAKAATATGGVDSSSPYGFGRSFMDNIFDTPIPENNPTTVPATVGNEITPDEASGLIDSLVSCSPNVQYEVNKVKLCVTVGENDDTPEYVAYDSNGQVVPDYPIPSAKITNIDRESNTATDELMQSYDLKIR